MQHLDINAESRIYVNADGETSGPYDANGIFALIGNGGIKPTDEIWIAGTEKSFPASELLPADCFATASKDHSESDLSCKRPVPPVANQGGLPLAGMLLGIGLLPFAIPILAPFVLAVLFLLLYGLKLN